MTRLLGLPNRVLPAVLMAISVALLAAGLLSYGAPQPSLAPVTPPVAPYSPAVLAEPTPQPSSSPVAFASPSATAPVGSPASSSASPSASGASASPSTPGSDPAVATRIVIPSEGIDLPVVSRDLQVPNQGPDLYPPCDVAVYHTAFSQPGEPGSTYIYAHARDGMFLPLLDASERNNGASLLGDLVQVYTDDNREFIYRISKVKRHATDFSLAENVAPGASQLVLQTSEGPAGTVPKLQVLALPVDVLPASQAAAHPKAHPRGCYGTP
jgi:hypothetical protein